MSNREEFEKRMKGTFGMLVDLRAREGTGFSYMDWGTQVAWVMWQARVPEGYVVVPVEINDEIESAMFSSVARGEMPCDIYKAMLEAVEK